MNQKEFPNEHLISSLEEYPLIGKILHFIEIGLRYTLAFSLLWVIISGLLQILTELPDYITAPDPFLGHHVASALLFYGGVSHFFILVGQWVYHRIYFPLQKPRLMEVWLSITFFFLIWLQSYTGEALGAGFADGKVIFDPDPTGALGVTHYWLVPLATFSVFCILFARCWLRNSILFFKVYDRIKF